jgi:ankyrin repeat protein
MYSRYIKLLLLSFVTMNSLRSMEDQSRLLLQATKDMNFSEIQRLLTRGVPATVVDSSGNTLLDIATESILADPENISELKKSKNREIVYELLKYGATPNIIQVMGVVKTPVYGATFLHMASLRGDKPLVKLFCANGAELNKQDTMGWTPLHYAIREDNLSIASYLLDHGASCKIHDNLGLVALHHAAENSKDGKTVKRLIKAGASVNKRGYVGSIAKGRTPLHLAVLSGRLAALKTLLESKADPNRPNSCGLTPLAEAINWISYCRLHRYFTMTPEYEDPQFCEQVVRSLLDAGACPYVDNEGSLRPIQHAQEGGCEDLAKIMGCYACSLQSAAENTSEHTDLGV